jgi:predicted TIM-barrel fold metal-dependent hydrolase
MYTKLFSSYDQSQSLFHEFDRRVISGEIGYIDPHGHIFSNKCVPADFLVDRMPFIQKFLMNDNVQPWIINLLRLWPGNEDKLELAADYIQNGSYSQRQILESWLHVYRGHEKATKKKWAVAPLMMDFEASFKEKPRLRFEHQAAEVMRYANLDEFKGRVLPFVFFDPRRNDLDSILAKTFAQGAVGVKTYPSLGYLPSHPNAMPYWEFFAQKGIPTVSHCSQEGKVHTHNNKIAVSGEYDQTGTQLLKPKTYNFSGFPWDKNWNTFFNHPSRWEPVLKQFPEFKLCIAHLGGAGDELSAILKHKTNTWFTTASRLARDYHNVYLDLSFVSNNDIVRKFVVDEILAKDSDEARALAPKIIYGSDYYMSTIGKKPERMAKESIADYGAYLNQIALENWRNFARPH